MGRTGRLWAFLFFAIAAFQGNAYAQNDTTFEIVNRARVPIFEAYVSPSSLDDWGPDVLRADVILPGARKTVRPAANDCIFDVRIVYRGGQSEERRRQNLCQLSEMAFDGGAPAPAPQTGAQGDPSFELVNASPSTITQIYASLSRERNWGQDRLGTEVLGARRRFQVALPNGDCRWDIAVVYADDRREEKLAQNLCNVTELAFDGSAARARGAAPPAARGNAQTATGDPSFALVNRSPRTIAQLYVSRSTETDWGRDRLGDNVLAAGRRFDVPLPQGPCQWDIAVVYDDDRREERHSQDLCAVSEVAFDASSARGAGTPNASAPAPSSGPEQSFGTGFFISAQGHMLTNAHVAGDCRRIGVMMETGRVDAQLVRKDERNDLALIKADVRAPVPFVRFRAQPSIRAGDDIVVSGFPLPTLLQNGLNITTGNVSAMSGLGGNIALMQITAPVQPGNSGGPLLDLSGNLVGVVVSKLNAQRVAQATGDIPQNVNFAVQGAVARLFLEAGGQRYVEAPSQRDMKAADVADLSRSFTFQIECR